MLISAVLSPFMAGLSWGDLGLFWLTLDHQACSGLVHVGHAGLSEAAVGSFGLVCLHKWAVLNALFSQISDGAMGSLCLI